MQQTGYGNRQSRTFCFCNVNMSCFLFAIAVLVGCVTVIGMGYRGGYIFASILCFIPCLLAIIAFFLRKGTTSLNTLKWIYVIAMAMNAIGFLIVCLMLILVIAFGFTDKRVRQEAGALLVILFIVLLVNLTLIGLFEYTMWLIYKEIKDEDQILPSFGGGCVGPLEANVGSAPPPSGIVGSNGSIDAKGPS